jgi:hypothetical protein
MDINAGTYKSGYIDLRVPQEGKAEYFLRK